MIFVLSFVLPALMLPSLTVAQTPIQSIADVWSKAKITVVPNTESFAGASSILKAMAHMPAPNVKPLSKNADPAPAKSSCDRDYGMLCPEHFVNIGPVKSGDELYCAGGSDYTGPCEGAYAFKGMSTIAKAQWSETCLASWPCKQCTRDFSTPCPQSWEQDGSGSCRPSSGYDGPCQMAFDFSSYNSAMREEWSNECNAFWSCLFEDKRASSNMGMVAGSRKPLSFLTSKSIPVDGYKIRNSLYLTQPMREPEQASVNVIVQEDLHKMQEESKYYGMEDQVRQLKQRIRDTLNLFSAQ